MADRGTGTSSRVAARRGSRRYDGQAFAGRQYNLRLTLGSHPRQTPPGAFTLGSHPHASRGAQTSPRQRAADHRETRLGHWQSSVRVACAPATPWAPRRPTGSRTSHRQRAYHAPVAMIGDGAPDVIRARCEWVTGPEKLSPPATGWRLPSTLDAVALDVRYWELTGVLQDEGVTSSRHDHAVGV